MIIRMISLAILTEALVELFFTAAPLQRIRSQLILKTTFLRSEEQGHLLDCKYCTSVWIAAIVLILATFADCQSTRLAAAAIIIARISNYAHLMYSWIYDKQINSRLERK